MIVQEQNYNQVPIQTVQDLYVGFVSAFNRSDAKGVTNYYTDDAILFPTNSSMVKGKENILLFWTECLKFQSNLTLVVQDVELQGDLLVEYGIYTMKDNCYPDHPQDVTGKYVVTWKNIDGNWKMYWDIFNPD